MESVPYLSHQVQHNVSETFVGVLLRWSGKHPKRSQTWHNYEMYEMQRKQLIVAATSNMPRKKKKKTSHYIMRPNWNHVLPPEFRSILLWPGSLHMGSRPQVCFEILRYTIYYKICRNTLNHWIHPTQTKNLYTNQLLYIVTRVKQERRTGCECRSTSKQAPGQSRAPLKFELGTCTAKSQWYWNILKWCL